MLKLIFIILFPWMSFASDACGPYFSERSFQRLPKDGLFSVLEGITMTDRSAVSLRKVTESYSRRKGMSYKIDTYTVQVINVQKRIRSLFVYVEYQNDGSPLWYLSSIKLALPRSAGVIFQRSFNYSEGMDIFKKPPPKDARYIMFSDQTKVQFERQSALITNRERQLFLIFDIGPNRESNSNLAYLYVTTL